MPRAEAAEIEAMVTEVAQSISPGVICQASHHQRPRLSPIEHSLDSIEHSHAQSG